MWMGTQIFTRKEMSKVNDVCPMLIEEGIKEGN
jgi:hypothetical protein